MKRTMRRLVRTALLGGAVLWLAIAALAQGQQPPAQPQAPQPPKPRRVVVTFDGQLEDVPEVKPEDFEIEVGKQKTLPTHILKPEELPTLIAIVLQDNQTPDFGSQLPALRDFILTQPPNTYLGIFYLNAQSVDARLRPPHFFSDLKMVAEALRIPHGSRQAAPPSPYDKIAQIVSFMDSLPEARKEILFFSEGSDSVAAQSNASPQQNTNLTRAIKLSQQAGIPIWAVYTSATAPESRLNQSPLGTPGVSRQAPSAEFGAMASPGSETFGERAPFAGISYLDYLTKSAGGKLFSPGKFAVDIRPYLTEFDKLLKQQVVLEYQGEGELRKVKMSRKLRGVRVLAPER